MPLEHRVFPAKVGERYVSVKHISIGNEGTDVSWKDLFEGFEGREVIIDISIFEPDPEA